MSSREEPLAPEDRVVGPESRHHRRERHERLIDIRPVDPAQLGILRISVVVSVLGASHLVAVKQHRHTLRQEQRGDEVALLACPDFEHYRIVGFALGSAIPRAVVRLTVVVVFTVGDVVLLVVRHKVTQCESVMGCDEVDGCHRPPTRRLIQFGRSTQPTHELAERGRLAPPEVADGIAVLAIPLCPLRGEVAHLVATGADVPGLGNQLHLGDHRILLHEFEEGRELIDVVELAGEGGCQVEPEPVDVHLGHPVAQRIHDQLE